MTLARTPEEERQMREALLALSKTGLPVYVADGGSPPPFVDFLHELGFEVFKPTDKGLVPQVSLSLKEAAARSGRPYLLYTEPDKADFFAKVLPFYLQLLQGEADVQCEIIARTEAAFATFPAMQQYVEKVSNELTQDVLGAKGDYTYGPFIFPAAHVTETQNLPAEFGWGWRFYLFARLVKAGVRLNFHYLPVSCPPSQRGENDRTSRLYRMKQLKQNIDGLLAGFSA